MLREYVKKYHSDVMYVLLDKLSKTKKIDFSKVDNKRVRKVVQMLAYDILIACFYINDEGETVINKQTLQELYSDSHWGTIDGKIYIQTDYGLNIVLSANDEDSLSDLVGAITVYTDAGEVIVVTEDEDSSRISIKNDYEEVIIKDHQFIVVRDGKREVIEDQTAQALNSAILFSRAREQERSNRKHNI